MPQQPQRRRLTFTFNRAVMKPWEEFEILLPSSESDGYKWELHQQASRPFEILTADRFPAHEPRACKFTLQGSQYGNFEVQARLSKETSPGTVKVKQAYTFKISVK